MSRSFVEMFLPPEDYEQIMFLAVYGNGQGFIQYQTPSHPKRSLRVRIDASREQITSVAIDALKSNNILYRVHGGLLRATHLPPWTGIQYLTYYLAGEIYRAQYQRTKPLTPTQRIHHKIQVVAGNHSLRHLLEAIYPGGYEVEGREDG